MIVPPLGRLLVSAVGGAALAKTLDLPTGRTAVALSPIAGGADPEQAATPLGATMPLTNNACGFGHEPSSRRRFRKRARPFFEGATGLDEAFETRFQLLELA
jgi:hypothetical protein